MVNKAIIIGNLGRDPEIRSTPSGQAVAKYSVATTRKWKDKDGNRQEATDWHNVVAWGRSAEIVGQYLTKGSKVYVEGRLQTDSWEDKETGKKMYRTEIVQEQMVMLGDKGGSGGSGSGRGELDRNDFGGQPKTTGALGTADDDGDIPF